MSMSDLAPKLNGIIAPVLTPFKTDKSVDYPTWERLVAWLIEHHVDALFVAGGSGEWQFLTPDERVELTRRAADVASGAVPIVAGSLGKDLRETVDLSKRVAQAGADYIGVVIPRFAGPDDYLAYSSHKREGDYDPMPAPDFSSPLEEPIVGFFQWLVEAFPYPTMIYDPPGSGEYGLQPIWLRRLAKLDPIVALKKTTRNLRVFSQLLEAAGESVAVIAGDETVMLPCLAVGAVGCIGGGGNMFPELMRAVYDSFMEGDLKTARRAHFELERINRLIEACGWPLSGKIALAARGFEIEPITRREVGQIRADDLAQLKDYFAKERYLL